MSNPKSNYHNPDLNKNQVNRLNKEDALYDIFKQQTMELDSDVNEDPNRERLLDESVDAFLDSKKE